MNIPVNDTIIFQHVLSNSGCAEWLALTAPLHLKYCLQHKMDYQLFFQSQLEDIKGQGHWAVPRFIHDFLYKGYKNVIYLDADCIIADNTVDLRVACVENKIGAVRHNLEYHEPDWSNFNAGALYVSNTEQVRHFMQYWMSRYPGTADFPWWEQVPLNIDAKEQGILNQLDNCFNAGHVSPSDHPVVWGLHGLPDRYEAMKKIVSSVQW